MRKGPVPAAVIERGLLIGSNWGPSARQLASRRQEYKMTHKGRQDGCQREPIDPQPALSRNFRLGRGLLAGYRRALSRMGVSWLRLVESWSPIAGRLVILSSCILVGLARFKFALILVAPETERQFFPIDFRSRKMVKSLRYDDGVSYDMQSRDVS